MGNETNYGLVTMIVIAKEDQNNAKIVKESVKQQHYLILHN